MSHPEDPALQVVLRMGRPLRGRWLLAITAGIGAAICAIGLAAVSAWLIVRASEQPPILYLLTAVTAVRAFGIGRGVLRYAERLAAHDAAFRVLAELRATTYGRLVRLAPAGLAEMRSGDLLARLVSDVDGLADLWLRILLPYAAAAIVAIGSIAILAAMVPAVGLLLAIGLLVAAVGAPTVMVLATRRAERAIAPARGRLGAAALDLVRGAPELVATGAAGAALATLEGLDDDLQRAEGRVALGAGLGGLVTNLSSGLTVWLSLVVGIAAVQDGSLPGVLLGVVALMPIAVHEVVAPLAPAATRLPGIAAAAERVVEVLRRPDPVREPEHPAAVPDGPIGFRATGLSARHPGADGLAFGPIDLEVHAGERVVVTGPSGSGKSTLVQVLLRFVDPAAGSLDLVGHAATTPVTAICGDAVRAAFGACLQDPHVFDATVEENVRIASPTAPREAIADALAATGLGAWVASLPDGLATRVGEAGTHLSGGQRQRIALARLVLSDARVILLDEPTEHLDEPAAAGIAELLLQIGRDRTVVVLTHRPELFPPSAWRRIDPFDRP